MARDNRVRLSPQCSRVSRTAPINPGSTVRAAVDAFPRQIPGFIRAFDGRYEDCELTSVGLPSREFGVKHLVIIAFFAMIAGLGFIPSAEATPIQAQFRVASRDAQPSTRITPTMELPPLAPARMVALMGTSVADRVAATVSAGAPLSVSWRSPFPSPVSLRIWKTPISEALNSVRDPRELKPR